MMLRHLKEHATAAQPQLPRQHMPEARPAGVQLAAVLKSELVGAVDQVASWAWAGIAASNAIVAVVVSKYARIFSPPAKQHP